MLNREIAPQFKQVDQIDFIKAKKTLLKNKIPVFSISGGEQNLVRIEFIFANVDWNEEKPLLASATNAMLNEGTHALTAAEIASKIDYYGSFFQTEFSSDRSSVTLYSLKKYLRNTLPIVKEILTDSVFPDKELKTYISNQKQKLKVSLEKNDFLARKQFNKLLFGQTLYGYSPDEKDYDLLKREDLQEYFAKAYHPKNCTIIVSGNVDEGIINELENLFGIWQSEVTFKVNQFKFEAPQATEHIIEKPQALQSAIRIGIPTINRVHPDFAAFQVLNTVLGGYFGSRLMANIREDKGYTYGIGSGNASFEQTGFFFIASEVGTDVCRNTLQEIEKEINLLKTELIPEEELKLVKNYLMGSLLGSLENAFSHADKFKNIHFFGLDYDYFEEYIQTIKNISAEELKDLANKYLNYESFVKVIVGKV
jgi:zinc protease